MSNTIIIAEIGENHVGDMDIAKTLIKQASEAGADYVKFQSYTPNNFKLDDPEYDWFKKVFLSDEAHFTLKKHAEKCGIKFLSSPFSKERARFLCEGLGLKEVKIASAVMLNCEILDYVNECAETVFLSTGMATLEEIRMALSHLNKIKKCYLLHCVTQYPCRDEEANLLAIKVLRKEFPDYEIGYSDHSVGYLAPIVAVALGAKVIEKHFTFDKHAKEGTDHVLSIEADELKDMVSQIRRVNIMLGNSTKAATEEEKKIIDFIRSRFIS